MNSNKKNHPAVCRFIDGIVQKIGELAAWLNILLILVILVQVVLRYGFGNGLVAMEELQWHIYAVLIMFGLSYCLTEDAHIRLDVFHRNFTFKNKEIIDFFGNLLLVMPLVIVIFVHGIDFVHTSWNIGERSDSPLGLPCRWIIKSILPFSMVLLGSASISRMIRACVLVFSKSNGDK